MFVRSDDAIAIHPIKDLLGCVDLIRRTRLRNILITSPVVVIEVGISYLNDKGVVGGMCLCIDALVYDLYQTNPLGLLSAQAHVYLRS